MKYRISVSARLIILFVLLYSSVQAGTDGLQSRKDQPGFEKNEINSDSDSLVVLWTTADREVALKMLCMYTFNAKKYNWWSDITIIVWGPSAKLLASDVELQEYFKKLMEAGISIKACKGCADQYDGVSEKLTSMGIDVLYVGKEFTDYLKSSRKILTL